MSKMIRVLLFLMSLAPGVSWGQTKVAHSFLLDATQEPAEMGLASSTVNDIIITNSAIWFGTGRGLSRTDNDGLSFTSFSDAQGIGRGGVSALAATDEIVWVATGFDSNTVVGMQQAGAGIAFSQDQGATWILRPQPGPIPISNITFDIALRGDEVWLASFAGGLTRSTDLGLTWEIVVPDTFIFDPGSRLNHRVFSVINADGTLWVGTAGGINRSRDGGETWTNFSHQNQTEAISGNFVVAITQQKYAGREFIWASTRETTIESNDETEFRGLSWTEDQGFSWRTGLQGETIWNIATDEDLVYAGSDNGLWISNDFGDNWLLFPEIENTDGSRKVLSERVFAIAITNSDRLWLGTGNGIASTPNMGATWDIFQAFTPTGREDEPRTYAFPNPFSPNIHNQLGDVGHVRFQYNTTTATTVTLKIYDFAMQHVATVAEGVTRPANGDFHEIWDGRNFRGEEVANGVYFYRLDLAGDGSYWGKLIVMK